jgi:hypothetical protein
MIKDPIVEEVRAARERLFDACNEDLTALLRQLKEREEQDRSRVVSRDMVKARQSEAPAPPGPLDVTPDPASVPGYEP